MSESQEVPFDLAVIGAGGTGIAAARFFLEVHPKAKVSVIERDHSVGGVWSKERVYPGFKSQGSLLSSGFSDIKFDPPKDELDKFDFYSAKSMADYYDNYIDQHEYDGRTLRERVQFGTTVAGIDMKDDIWTVDLTNTAGQASKLRARKVIVASGASSAAQMPNLPGRESFGGPVIHTLNYGKSKIFEKKDIKSVAVVGGGKSAADMVYENVKAGRAVNWIIRDSGKGPGTFLSPNVQIGACSNAVELSMTRGFVNALVWPGLQKLGWWQWFLYKTTIGVWLLRKLTGAMAGQFTADAKYESRAGARDSFKLLAPELDGLSANIPTGLVQQPDFWETVAPNVDVYREDIERLEQGRIVFKSGLAIEADAILCGTGFSPTIPFFTPEQCIDLGLPHQISAEPVLTSKEWSQLNADAEAAVRQRFYSIESPPSVPSGNKFGDIDPSDTPFRLYQTIAPISPKYAHKIAFVGFAIIVNMFAAAEVEAIWATAYLDGNLKLPKEEEMKRTVAYETTYMRLRNPTYGRIGTFWVFDFFEYLEGLLGEVGLGSHRRSWWREMFYPLRTEDLRGLKDEYLRKFGKDE